MTFGQTSGPPASAAQLGELAELFERMGFASFREARHPYGLSQRQSNGKFTRTEADELIDRLQGEANDEPSAESSGESAASTSPAVRHPATRSSSSVTEPEGPVDVVLAFPDEILADELHRRGWICTPPT